MRSHQSRGLPRLSAAAAILVCAATSSSVTAGSDGIAPPPPTLRPSRALEAQRPSSWAPGLPHQWLDDQDRMATLHAIHIALTSVGDGGAYVWRRSHGLLGGTIRPTASFKAASGSVCRHIIVRLNSRMFTRQAEGIACRDNQGTWSLSG